MSRTSMRGLALCLAVAAGLALPACGGESEPVAAPEAASEADPGGTSESGAGAEVEIVDFKFAPETITVSAGDEVTWHNRDTAPHNAIAEDGSFKTADLEQDDEDTVQFDEPGTYAYYCSFHAFMKATIEVEEN